MQWIGPGNFHCPADEWINDISEVSKENVPTPPKSTIEFSTDRTSLSRNTGLLASHGHDMAQLFESQRGTTVWRGSEFRKEGHLQRVLRRHPMLSYLMDVFDKGMDYLFTQERDEEERTREVEQQLTRGNRKSALDREEEVIALLAKDVKHGFCFPVSARCILRVKGGMVQTCGVAIQFGPEADGSRKEKEHLTHNLSYSISGKGVSVNNRVDIKLYPEMFYGWCLSRVLHFIASLRAENPDQKIFISQFDSSDAYQRISHSGNAASKTILVVGEVAYIMLRLAFGGSPNPPCFCAFLEALTDLAKKISCSNFEPKNFNITMVKPEHLIPRTDPNPRATFAKGIRTAFEVPLWLDSRKDCFINDIINVFLGTEKNMRREGHTVPLAVHLLSRPHVGDKYEPIPRRPLLGPSKLEAEGRASDIQVCLGWGVDTRAMIVFLPNNKFKAWIGDLRDVVQERKTTFSSLDSLVGRLNDASFVIPLSRHFLNTLRQQLWNQQPFGGKQVIRLNQDEIADLELWDLFLQKSHEGISINLLTVCHPTSIGWSDSCPFGLGGFTLRGSGLRIKIPKWCSFWGDDLVNNLLEFLGMGITILLLINETKEDSFPSHLALGDNTSAIGWLFKLGRIDSRSKYYEPTCFIARNIVRETMLSQSQLASQHLQGRYNNVANLLLFEGEDRGKTNMLTRDCPRNEILTQRIILNWSPC